MFWCCNQFEINMFIFLPMSALPGATSLGNRFKFLRRQHKHIKACSYHRKRSLLSIMRKGRPGLLSGYLACMCGRAVICTSDANVCKLQHYDDVDDDAGCCMLTVDESCPDAVDSDSTVSSAGYNCCFHFLHNTMREII